MMFASLLDGNHLAQIDIPGFATGSISFLPGCELCLEGDLTMKS